MNETTNSAVSFAPVWKRKWLILAVAILVGLGSYFYFKREPSLFSASTQIYLGNGAEEQSQIGASANGGKKANAPNPETQAALINSSVIKEIVRVRLRKQHKSAAVRAALKGKTKAKSAEKSEFITITGEARNARGTALLVNTVARAYIKRQNAHYYREVQAAISLTRRQIRRIEAGEIQRSTTSKGKTSSKSSTSTTATLQAATLSTKINELESDLAISEVTQLDPATRKTAKLLSPHPKNNAIFGFAIGLLLATLAVFTLSRFDRRLRSLAAIEAIFQTQILTALPAVRRPLGARDGYPVAAKALREALWRLQTTLQVGQTLDQERETPPRVIMCVSADAGDGKSTLVAALGLAQSQAGERVAVVEADFRRPVQSRLLGLAGPQGLADVLTGRLTVGEAMQTVSLVSPVADVSSPSGGGAATATVVESAGSLSVLIGATTVDNPPALLARPGMSELPRALAEEYDHVLIDAPAPLQVSDVIPLLAVVDGIVIVARVGHTRETSAERLVQMLRRMPSAPILGVVANAVSQADIERYGLYSAPHRRGWRRTLIGR